MSGFSYNGIHCDELGLTYAPGPKDRMFSSVGYKPNTQSVTGHAGAYWYGNVVSERSFS